MPYFNVCVVLCLFSLGCNNSNTEAINKPNTGTTSNEVSPVPSSIKSPPEERYTSQSIGTVSAGKLVNGVSVPFTGNNFRYFDSLSYKTERSFLNDRLLSVVLKSYQDMETKFPKRQFVIMECSNKNGGIIHPHRTHQNGLSIDFMVPLKRNNQPCYDYDQLGGRHYLLDFNNDGKLLSDKTVQIDFDVLAKHLLSLDSIGKTQNVIIKKVILKTELKKPLFNTISGNVLKSKGIYFVQKLTPLINELHDDHYHIDFEIK